MKNEVRFRNLSRSHGVPSPGIPMSGFAVGRWPWTWRGGTHGMGSTQYCFKGSAFAHPTSPILPAPGVSGFICFAAVDVDVVNPGCITAPERILEEFPSLGPCLFFFFFLKCSFIMGFSWFSLLCLCRFSHTWFTYREISILRFQDAFESDIFFCGE